MLGWIVIGFIISLYLVAIDPPWLRKTWDAIVLLLTLCLETTQRLIFLLPHAFILFCRCDTPK